MSLSIGFPASSLLINGQTAAAATTASKTLIAQTATQAAAEDKEGDKKDDVNVDMNEIGASGSSSEGLSVTTANLLKRLAELQQQLEKIQQQMQAAENASYPTPEAKTTAVMGFQSQVSSITGAIQQVSAQLMKEMSKSGGVNTTA
ncbi:MULTISPECIES: hypothetical protein [Pseudomonas]|jgi:hypothetical protein|uniref:Uncharacterized protein n=1 Tax=Pseudomonas syringae TaxID=317 RepID=A0A085VLQ0_PSESX|nr:MULTISPECIES: hypothetical protein [Pseudomonas]EPJ87609.1 hypothetical protein CFII64_07290 [Pseudomonas sp. CFII64]KFE56363.1 hypothetical protein IV02_00565 [Pseudomonas syringae]